ncbi:probable low affinity copper uptake protein 2 isoform X1 [Nematostella vectensis]|nr:probable low affinity copper uptake protein 2 isoform X1 [Nematostella vectensis]
MKFNATALFQLEKRYCLQCMSAFHATTKQAQLLFEDWKLSSSTILIGSCAGVFFLSILSECVRALRSRIADQTTSENPNATTTYKTSFPKSTKNEEFQKDLQTEANGPQRDVSSSEAATDENTACTIQNGSGNELLPDIKQERPKLKITSKIHFLQLSLHILQVILGYALMLVIMTMDIWLGLAVVLGLGTGYFICTGPFQHSGPLVHLGKIMSIIPLKAIAH